MHGRPSRRTEVGRLREGERESKRGCVGFAALRVVQSVQSMPHARSVRTSPFSTNFTQETKKKKKKRKKTRHRKEKQTVVKNRNRERVTGLQKSRRNKAEVYIHPTTTRHNTSTKTRTREMLYHSSLPSTCQTSEEEAREAQSKGYLVVAYALRGASAFSI